MPAYSPPPVRSPQAPQGAALPTGHQPGRALRAAALTAVTAGVLVLAAAAFVLSYSGIHAVARQAGVPVTLARGYPVIFDAMLVVACAAVLSLRSAGLPSKLYAWLSLLALLSATAGADALHATSTVVPHRTAALVAAVLPWALLLIGFGLLLAMLRHFRLHRAAQPPGRVIAAAQPAALPAALPPAPGDTTAPTATGSPGQPEAEAASEAGPTREPAAAGEAGRAHEAAAAGRAAGAAAARAGGTDEASAAKEAGGAGYRGPGAEPAAGDDEPADGQPAESAPQPAFHRMWSSPTPPGDDEP